MSAICPVVDRDRDFFTAAEFLRELSVRLSPTLMKWNCISSQWFTHIHYAGLDINDARTNRRIVSWFYNANTSTWESCYQSHQEASKDVMYRRSTVKINLPLVWDSFRLCWQRATYVQVESAPLAWWYDGHKTRRSLVGALCTAYPAYQMVQNGRDSQRPSELVSIQILLLTQ